MDKQTPCTCINKISEYCILPKTVDGLVNKIQGDHDNVIHINSH